MKKTTSFLVTVTLLLGAISFIPSLTHATPVSWDGNFSTQIIQPLSAFVNSVVKVSSLSATSTTATSTFAGGLAVKTSALVVDSTTGNVGVGTASPSALFSVGSSNSFLVADTGRTGILTAVPSSASLAIGRTTNGGPALLMLNTTGGNSSLFGLDGSGNGEWWLYNSSASPTIKLYGGGQVSYINTGQNFGIGDQTPAALLTVGSGDLFQVNSSGAIAAVTGITTSGAYTQSGTSANTFTGTATFSNATYSALFTGGNVGIGDSTPAALFTVGNGDLFQVNSSGAIAAATGITSTGSVSFTTSTATTTIAGGLKVNSTKLIVDRSTGFVGIGTASPAYALDVDAGTTAQVANFTADSSSVTVRYNNSHAYSTSNTVSFQARLNTDTTNRPATSIISSFTNITDATRTSSVSFNTINNGGSLTPILNIVGANVGIGDTTPAALLTVGSGDLFQVDSSGRAFLPAGASGAGNLALSTTADTNTGLYFSAADEIRVQTGGSDRITINSSGNVGISSTTPFTKLAIGADGSITTTEKTLATSTSMTVDWTKGNQQLVRVGTSATTIGFSNYLAGQTLRLVVCSPGSTRGAVTFTGVLWPSGTAPTLTTTANKCDIAAFIATNATSSLVIMGGSNLNY